MWCMAHPWLTFFLIVLFIYLVDNVVNNILRFKVIKSQSKNKKIEE